MASVTLPQFRGDAGKRYKQMRSTARLIWTLTLWPDLRPRTLLN